MSRYRVVGEVPRKRHMQFRDPSGKLYAEELMGVEGFSSDQSLLYHRGLPTAIVSAEIEDEPVSRATVPNHPLMPRHFKTHDLRARCDLVAGRQLLIANDDVRISYVAGTDTSELYRNAIRDERVYIESGTARME